MEVTLLVLFFIGLVVTAVWLWWQEKDFDSRWCKDYVMGAGGTTAKWQQKLFAAGSLWELWQINNQLRFILYEKDRMVFFVWKIRNAFPREFEWLFEPNMKKNALYINNRRVKTSRFEMDKK